MSRDTGYNDGFESDAFGVSLTNIADENKGTAKARQTSGSADARQTSGSVSRD